jgi:hypothetical protein
MRAALGGAHADEEQEPVGARAKLRPEDGVLSKNGAPLESAAVWS